MPGSIESADGTYLAPSVRSDTVGLKPGGTAVILTLDAPSRLNAIDAEMLQLLDDALDDVARDPDLRTLLITGAGRAFSAGGDLKRYLTLQRDAVAFPRFIAELHRVFGRLRTIAVPVVAVVNGVTAAGGLELMLSCDLAFAARSAPVRDGHQNFGQMGGGGVLTLLPRVVGIQRAAELIFTGRALQGAELVEWGLVNRVLDDEELMPTALAFAEEVARKSPLAIATAKQAMNTIWSHRMSVPAGLQLELERDAYYCLTSHDAPEGLLAFSDKRPPRFLGR